MNQTGAKLRERTEGIVGKGRELFSGYCGSGENKSDTTTSAERRDDIH